MVNGKAKLVREDFCGGLGDCLPVCPTGAISFEMRQAPEYDSAAAGAAKKAAAPQRESGCPGSRAAEFPSRGEAPGPFRLSGAAFQAVSRLRQWPCQIKLVPAQAPFFDGADLLVAADCTAYSYAAMHEDFMKGKVTLIGCPKLDGVDYTGKLTEIIAGNAVKSVELVRMEVPCCGGLQRAVEGALRASGKSVPWQVVTISRRGEILE